MPHGIYVSRVFFATYADGAEGRAISFKMPPTVGKASRRPLALSDEFFMKGEHLH